jgi:hypothetical protein
MGVLLKGETIMCLTHILTYNFSRVLKNPTAAQLVKKLSVLCGNQRCVTTFTRVCHWTLSDPFSITRSTPSHTTTLRYTLVVPLQMKCFILTNVQRVVTSQQYSLHSNTVGPQYPSTSQSTVHYLILLFLYPKLVPSSCRRLSHVSCTKTDQKVQ